MDSGLTGDAVSLGRAFFKRSTNTAPSDGAYDDEFGEHTDGEHAEVDSMEWRGQHDITDIAVDSGLINDFVSLGGAFNDTRKGQARLHDATEGCGRRGE